MKVAQINSVCDSGSTGKISVSISRLLTEHEIDNVIFYVQGNSDYKSGKKYMSSSEVQWQALKAKVCGNYGFQAKHATYKLIKSLEKFRPDIVQLHNLHGHNVHLGLLFSYFKKRKIKVFWTFHDCWAFTGYCMYFDTVACDQWRKECKKCPQRKKYSWFRDQSNRLYKKKRALFSDLDMTIITPSQWMADLVKESFLKDYPVKVIHNGIDLSVFCPRESDFRKKHGISESKKLLLGVANKWERRKGLDIFVKLSQRLDEKKYRIVLVGTDSSVDKQLPQSIISIHRTANQIELAKIYSAADYFINPTREDNFPTVNIEALACGTPVITFDTGGSAEIPTKSCGNVVPCNDLNELCFAIEDQSVVLTQAACVKRASEFDCNEKYRDYLECYRNATGNDFPSSEIR